MNVREERSRPMPRLSPTPAPPPLTHMDQPVVAAVITRDSRVLVCLRPAHKRHGGLWEFPGGKIEEGETHLDATRRELREELGVEVVSISEVEFSREDPGSPFRIDFVAAEIRGEPVPLEHEEIAWVTAEQLDRMDLAPSDLAYARFHVRKAFDG